MIDDTDSYVFAGNHWFCGKAVQFAPFPRWGRPKGLRQWTCCIWNMDIFFGPIPFLKCLALACLLLSAGISLLVQLI